MIIHRLSPTDNIVRTTEQNEQSARSVPGLFESVSCGDCLFLEGAWLFGARICNGSDEWFDVNDVVMTACLKPKDGSPGNCDLHVIEARLDGRLVLRSACAIAEGIDVKIPTTAGQAGAPQASVTA